MAMFPEGFSAWQKFSERARDSVSDLAVMPHPASCCWPRSLSRREFLQAAMGAAALSATSRFWFPNIVHAGGPTSGLPKPIPGGLNIPGLGLFHVLLPGHPAFGAPDPAANDPSTITDFNGQVGLAYVQGTGTRTDKITGEVRHLPFEADLRFMTGEYVGMDGRHHHDAFALI